MENKIYNFNVLNVCVKFNLQNNKILNPKQ